MLRRPRKIPIDFKGPAQQQIVVIIVGKGNTLKHLLEETPESCSSKVFAGQGVHSCAQITDPASCGYADAEMCWQILRTTRALVAQKLQGNVQTPVAFIIAQNPA